MPVRLRGALASFGMALATLQGALPNGSSPPAASGPSSWGCDARRLGLDKVVVERAPVVKAERFGDGRAIKNGPDERGAWVPVILVHGWTSQSTHPSANGKTGAFSAPIDLTPSAFAQIKSRISLAGTLQDLAGAAVFTYDYHPYSGRWVTDAHLGPGLGKAIDCLAKASGQKVIVVGHSMGGLMARYAASAPGPGGAKDRSGEISRIVTLGTPNTGSVLAAVVGGVVDVVPGKVAAVIRLILSACGSATTTDMDASVCSIVPFVGAFEGEAGTALRAGSAELRALKPVPKAIPVDALAGSTNFSIPKLGWFAWPWETTDIPVGDIIVSEASATAGAVERREVTCRYQLSPVRRKTDEYGLMFGLTSRGDVADVPAGAANGPCFHTSLMRTQDLTNEVLGVIGDDIGDRYLSRTDLLSAPVPSLRGNRAGTLVNGVLPGTGNGYVGLERSGGAAPALGDLNGDGRGDGVAVITASSGAGGTDATVIAYAKRNRQLVQLATFDPARARDDTYHAYVTGMIITDGAVQLRWDTDLYGTVPGPSMAATLRLRGNRFVVSNLREDDGATAGALPAYPQTTASAQDLEGFLRRNNLQVTSGNIEVGCEALGVLGADLAAGDVDLYDGASLCDGDPITTYFSIRGAKIVRTDWAAIDAGIGNVAGWKDFAKPYGQRHAAVFDLSPGDVWFYLTPRD